MLTKALKLGMAGLWKCPFSLKSTKRKLRNMFDENGAAITSNSFVNVATGSCCLPLFKDPDTGVRLTLVLSPFGASASQLSKETSFSTNFHVVTRVLLGQLYVDEYVETREQAQPWLVYKWPYPMHGIVPSSIQPHSQTSLSVVSSLVVNPNMELGRVSDRIYRVQLSPCPKSKQFAALSWVMPVDVTSKQFLYSLKSPEELPHAKSGNVPANQANELFERFMKEL